MLWMDVDTALSEVPVNVVPLTDDTDFKTREESVVYNQAGLDLVWNFVTTAGAYTQTAVTPTETAGDYDWTNQGNGMYSIEIPASGGASINNDTEGFGWFSGYATGILPWSGPIIGFRAAGLNNLLIDDAHSATRGLAGTALPAAAADAAGGLPISDAGGLDLDNRMPAAAAITNLNTVFDTDFATNYNATRNAWATNVQDTVGSGNLPANVTQFGGTNGTFALGLPSVNTTYWNGTAISTEIPTMLISSGTGAGQLNVTSGVIDSNLVQMVGVAQSATDLKDFADDGYDPATNKVQGVVLVDTTTTNTDMRGTDNAATAAELAKVPKSDSNVTWNATAAAQIQSEANDAIVANHLDHLFTEAYDPTSKPGNASGLLNVLVENDSGVPRYTINALEQAPAGGGGGGLTEQNITDIGAEVESRLSGRTIVIQSPLDGNKVTLYANAEYTTGTQRLTVTNSTGGGWPDGATYTELKFVVRTNGTETAYGTGAWVVTSGAGASVALSFTSEEMAALLATAPQENATCGVWAYQSGDESTRFPLLAEGKLRLVDVPWVSS